MIHSLGVARAVAQARPAKRLGVAARQPSGSRRAPSCGLRSRPSRWPGAVRTGRSRAHAAGGNGERARVWSRPAKQVTLPATSRWASTATDVLGRSRVVARVGTGGAGGRERYAQLGTSSGSAVSPNDDARSGRIDSVFFWRQLDQDQRSLFLAPALSFIGLRF